MKPLSDKDRKFLKAMAKDDEESSIASIKTRLESSDSIIQTYRKRLISSGIIASERRGYLTFVVPYLGEYLRGAI